MLTSSQSSCIAQPGAQSARRGVRTLWLVAALALAACGGGSRSSVEPPASGQPPAPPAQSKGTVVIQVTTTSGTPVPDISVGINGGFDGRGMKTDASGQARFTEVPAGEASAHTWDAGYHRASSRFSIVRDATTTVPIVVESVTEAVPVLLAVRSVPSSDGSSMSLELDIAVLDEQGMARETLTEVDFGLDGDCGWAPCVTNADGSDARPEYPGYGARVQGASLVPVSNRASTPLATAFLLDQSERMAAFDPDGLRALGLASFLESVSSPDSVTLGSYYDAAAPGDASRPEINTYGLFTSDTSALRPIVESLPGQETGRNTIAATTSAIAELVHFTSSNASGASSGSRRSVVVLDTNPSGAISFPHTCQDSCSDLVQAARSAGISVVAIGSEDSYAHVLAARTQGASVHIVAPEQLQPALRGLDSFLSGSLAFNRVRLVLEAGSGTLLPGRLVSGYLTIRIGPNTQLTPWITVPIVQQ